MPKVYDLFCGLGGWSEGFLAEGYECVGFDIERHDYGSGGYPGTLILRDVRSIHGSELKDATVIVGSSPCQEFSYRAMPWKKAKALPPPYLGMELFNAQFRIQREASEAAGHHIPMVVENVRGAQKWVGRAQANFGSFYLWGDVGMVGRRVVVVVNGRLISGSGVAPIRAAHKVPGFRFDGNGGSFQSAAVKVAGLDWGKYGQPGYKAQGFNVVAAQRFREERSVDQESGVKQGGDWFGKNCKSSMSRLYGSKSDSRKAASAMIAKIPLPLSTHIARTFKPSA